MAAGGYMQAVGESQGFVIRLPNTFQSCLLVKSEMIIRAKECGMPFECRDRDIVISPAGGTLNVFLRGKKIVETGQALALKEGNYPIAYYVPRSALNGEILVDSDHQTICPFKGQAAYHHLKIDGEITENAVWYYPEPCPLVAEVADHVAFWGDDMRVEHLPA